MDWSIASGLTVASDNWVAKESYRFCILVSCEEMEAAILRIDNTGLVSYSSNHA